MAVDSREKRFSMLNLGDGNHWHATFEADGSVDADDRLHLLDLYSGLAATGVVVVTGIYKLYKGKGVSIGKSVSEIGVKTGDKEVSDISNPEDVFTQ